MSTTTTIDDLANVPRPAGATEVYDWEDLPDAPSRYFVGSSWLIERDNEDNLNVVINGTQWPDHTDHVITLQDVKHDILDALTAGQAHQLGVALIQAAFEMARWTAVSTS